MPVAASELRDEGSSLSQRWKTIKTVLAMNALDTLLGLTAEPKNLTLLQISFRGVVVFVDTLIMMRLGDRRSLAQKSAFDLALIVIIASVLARAINGSGPFFATLAGSFVIVLLHRLLARLVYQWPSLNRLIKGRPVVLLRDGQFEAEGMHALLVTREDIEEDMRLEARVENPQAIKLASLEPSGDISFILKETE